MLAGLVAAAVWQRGRRQGTVLAVKEVGRQMTVTKMESTVPIARAPSAGCGTPATSAWRTHEREREGDGSTGRGLSPIPGGASEAER